MWFNVFTQHGKIVLLFTIWPASASCERISHHTKINRQEIWRSMCLSLLAQEITLMIFNLGAGSQ